jgi:hypothetical protein
VQSCNLENAVAIANNMPYEPPRPKEPEQNGGGGRAPPDGAVPPVMAKGDGVVVLVIAGELTGGAVGGRDQDPERTGPEQLAHQSGKSPTLVRPSLRLHAKAFFSSLRL